MVRTGGSIGGVVSAGVLEKELGKHIHPEYRKRLVSGGFFDKLSGIIGLANKAYSAIDKGIQIGTKGYKAYGQFKTAFDKSGPKVDAIDTTDIVTGAQSQVAKRRGGKLTAGSMPTAGAMKNKRVLPQALRERAKRMGELMKAGHSMKVASEMYKKEQNK